MSRSLIYNSISIAVLGFRSPYIYIICKLVSLVHLKLYERTLLMIILSLMLGIVNSHTVNYHISFIIRE